MRHTFHMLGTAIVAGLLVSASPFVPAAHAQGGTFTATAAVKTSAGAQATAPVTVVVTRLTTDKDRAALVEVLKKGGTAAVVQAFKPLPDLGYIEVGGIKTPIKYAYVRPMEKGRLVTVITATPILHLGAGAPDAKPKAGFDVGIAILQVMDGSAGTGELVPAATIKADATGAVETQDYGAEIVRLTNVQGKK